MQCIKQKPTLRISEKYELKGEVKLTPKIIFSEGTQNNELADYHLFRDLILDARNIQVIMLR